MTIGHAVVYYARAAYAFSAGIRYRHCRNLQRILLGFSRFILYLSTAKSNSRVSTESPLAVWPGRCINVRRCEGLYIVHMQLQDPLEPFLKGRKFLPGSVFSLSNNDMT